MNSRDLTPAEAIQHAAHLHSLYLASLPPVEQEAAREAEEDARADYTRYWVERAELEGEEFEEVEAAA